MWKLTALFLNNPGTKTKITREIRKYFRINENENNNKTCGMQLYSAQRETYSCKFLFLKDLKSVF